MNAYFVYNVVGVSDDKCDNSTNGANSNEQTLSYETALLVVFIEGILFLIFSMTECRKWIGSIIPLHLKSAIPFGIGIFLAWIGIIDIVGSKDCVTLVKLSWQSFLGMIGFILIMLGTIYKFKGTTLIIIVLISMISYLCGVSHYHTKFLDLEYFVPQFETFGTCFSKKPWNSFEFTHFQFYISIGTFLIVDILDTTGALYGLADYSNLLDKSGDYSDSKLAFCADAIGTIIGAIFGTSPVTSFVESAAGIKEGGKTGVTAIVVSFFFGISSFCAPIFVSVPSFATGPALIVIGLLMTRSALKIKWGDLRVSFPVGVTIVLMPISYSIAYGIIGGISTHGIIVISDKIIHCIHYCHCPTFCQYICCDLPSSDNKKKDNYSNKTVCVNCQDLMDDEKYELVQCIKDECKGTTTGKILCIECFDYVHKKQKKNHRYDENSDYIVGINENNADNDIQLIIPSQLTRRQGVVNRHYQYQMVVGNNDEKEELDIIHNNNNNHSREED